VKALNGAEGDTSNGVGGNGGAVIGVGEEGEAFNNPEEYPKEAEDCCAVCGDVHPYGDNNEIIYCDGCNVAVHQGAL
jgi:hypothetical protein